MSYRLTKEADEDIIAIYMTGAAEFGLEQADRYHDSLEQAFAFLADYPQAAREREEFTQAVRAHPHKSHIIIYREEEDDILIIRIRHARENWISNPVN